MARRRFQRGHLRLRGDKWVGMWRDDVVLPDGTVKRVRRSEILGTKKDYPTKALAKRALHDRLEDVNSLTYRPKPTATFAEFAKKWVRDVLTQHKRSTQSAERSRIKKHLIAELGDKCMKDINREMLQTLVAKKRKTLSAKSVRNLSALLSMMWVQASADGYTQIDPFAGLVLPEPELIDEPFLTLDEMKLVIDTAPEPYKTYYWILAETGIRCGEACGLPTKNLLLDIGAIKITQKVWHGQIETVKSKKGNRLCEISPQLAEHLRGYLRTWRPNRLGLLFATRNGTPWDADVVRKRKLYPLLEKNGNPFRSCGPRGEDIYIQSVGANDPPQLVVNEQHRDSNIIVLAVVDCDTVSFIGWTPVSDVKKRQWMTGDYHNGRTYTVPAEALRSMVDLHADGSRQLKLCVTKPGAEA